VSDEEDIRQLIGDLAIQADTGEIEDYLALFTDDAVWEMPANAATGVPAAHYVGQADIRAGVEGRRGMGVQGPGTAAKHHISTIRLGVDGDDATAHIYYQFLNRVDGQVVIQTFGQYHDRYRRTAAGWKLAHRTILLG